MAYTTSGSNLQSNLDDLPTAGAFQNLDGTWVDGVTAAGWYKLMTSDGTPGVENRFRVHAKRQAVLCGVLDFTVLQTERSDLRPHQICPPFKSL